MNSLWYGSRALAAGIGAALILGTPSLAEARTEVLKWTHPDPGSVDGFNIYFGTARRSYGAPIDAGKPVPDSTGVYSFTLQVPPSLENETLYIAVTASSGDGEESLYSNERIRTLDGEPPPPPPPPPPPADGEPKAAVMGFVLWDASSGTVLDADFRSGEQISPDAHGSCLAIEVLGNAYLELSGSPGSVKFSFDDPGPTACSNPPLSHEDNPPYAWEEEAGPGQFSCAASLTESGPHTLTATPYDGDGCTGTEGIPVTLSFEVLDATPQDAALGKPGQPFLVP